jgi:hypothetical protein
MAGQNVWVFPIDPSSRLSTKPVIKGVTDAEGVAVFPSEVFGYENILVQDVNGVSSGSQPTFKTTVIMRTGVVGNNDCTPKSQTSSRVASPGELTIYVRRLHWWEGGLR